MSELNEHSCVPEGLPLYVRRYNYRKENFSQIVDIDRERLRRLTDSIKTMSNTIYNDGNLDTLEKPEDVSEYIIFSIDIATYDLDFLNPNVEPKLGIRTTFDQNIDLLAVKIVLTVVVEVVITETHTKLIRDIGRWLDPIDGLAKQYGTAKAEIENVQTIEMIESSKGDEVTLTGGHFSFRSIFFSSDLQKLLGRAT
ncbi:hypothetical protein N7449_006554 [Penicillium cf. viridicatum]|uniref:Uncharacterized protein n=1 Tax=Penicillium cf. viridicatum TaxID=2972119 RepID=A0A9W9MB88_9EURO|nr:hypothetical protein N7449_006554 [Penicillium cf. viridicatum]